MAKSKKVKNTSGPKLSSKTKGNRNYKRGSANERKIRTELMQSGGAILAMRGAGSKSPVPKELATKLWAGNPPKVDLVALMDDGSVELFQVKPAQGRVKPKEREALLELAGRFPCRIYEAWWEGGHGNYNLLTDEGRYEES